MKVYLNAKTKPVPFRFFAFCFTLFSLSLFSNNTYANLCQEHILNVGINLGWSVATLALRGDQNPQDARTIAESLTRAAQHVNAAASLFRLPYRTERLRTGTDQHVIDKINRYFQRAPNLSVEHRASYIANIWSMYRQSFQTTFQAPTPGEHYYPNCDFFILDIGYHFGRAHIAAGVNSNQARTYQSGANGSVRLAIREGLNVAVDGYEYGIQTNVRKACCCFGKEAFWRRLPAFQWNSPFALYADNLPVLQRIVLDAGVVPKRCTCGGTPIDPPPDGGGGNDQNNNLKWEYSGTGDCPGLDVGQTNGIEPAMEKLNDPEAKCAVCWNGDHKAHPGRAFCTYKRVTCDSCRGGENTGRRYKKVRR
jgi:hypothetical protein